MSNAIGVVSLAGFYHEDSQYTFLAASGITTADRGKAVTKTANTNEVALASDGDVILGRIEQVEVRTQEGITVATVSTNGGMLLKLNPNASAASPDEIPVPGEYVEGSDDAGAGGYVQKSSGATKWQVMEINDTDVTVLSV